MEQNCYLKLYLLNVLESKSKGIQRKLMIKTFVASPKVYLLLYRIPFFLSVNLSYIIYKFLCLYLTYDICIPCIKLYIHIHSLSSIKCVSSHNLKILPPFFCACICNMHICLCFQKFNMVRNIYCAYSNQANMHTVYKFLFHAYFIVF